MSLNSAFIAHQIWLQRYASRTANNLSSFVGKMRDEVRDRVNGFGDESRTRTRLSKMLRGLEDALYLVTGDWHDRLLGDLKDLGEYEAGWTARTLKANVAAEFVVPSPSQVWAAAEFNPLSLSNKPVGVVDLLEGWQDTEVSRLVTGVKSGFVQGKPTRDIVKEVVGVGGLADVSERNAATAVRTAVNHVSTQAKEETYRQNDDVVEGYIWVSTLDKRTSTICKARDGMVFELGKGPLPPAHPNCRSTTAPKVNSDFDFLLVGGRRAARGSDGGMQVGINTNYYDFLKQQPAWLQDEALGPTRGAIFRNAGLSPEEFRSVTVDGFGRPLTLKEMAALDVRVAEYLAKRRNRHD